MSHLSEELERQLRASGRSQTDLERIDPVLDQSFVSRVARGKQTNLSKDQTFRLAHALSKDRASHAELYIARLLDELPEPELVAITSQAAGLLTDRPKASSEFELAMAFLSREAMGNLHLRKMLIRLHKLLTKGPDKPGEEKPAPAKTYPYTQRRKN